MFTGLAALPLITQILIVVGVFVAAVILAFLGKVSLNIGKYKLNFGKPRTAQKTRVCSDCRKLVMTRTMQFDQAVKMVKEDILRDQMNFTEQKIHEITYDLTSSYRQDIISCREKDKQVDCIRETKEYLLYQEALGNAMIVVKNEVRKAFKENGFFDMNEPEFDDYVKGKTRLLINIAREYIRSRYPFENMMVPIEWRFNRLPEKQIETIAFDVFTKAKQIKQSADEKIVKLGEEYDNDIDELRR